MRDKDLEKIFKLINQMEKKRILKNYAIGGAVATIYYTEPFFTQDIDIFFIPSNVKKLIILTQFYDFLLKKGGKVYKEFILINKIPVQFIPASKDLEKEAIKNSLKVKFKNIEIKILKAEYLIAIFLDVFRPKDREKIIKLMEQAKIDIKLLYSILKRYNLYEKFDDFKKKYYGEQS
ncbi:MAG TPA: hypothetical protein PKV21_09965, partial [bacterium]|nr:hypothetical protein [bacterium]